MKYKVLDKKHNSRSCMICGVENEFGMKARFYELSNKELVCFFHPKDWHQSYPDRLHGGMAAAILDETIGRAIDAYEKGTFAVTVEFEIKYKKPVPLNKPLKAIGRILTNSRKIFEAEGEILLEDGSVAVTAKGKYLKIQDETLGEKTFSEENWFVIEEDNDPDEIEL